MSNEHDPEIKSPGGIILPNPDYVGPAERATKYELTPWSPKSVKRNTDVVPEDVIHACAAECMRDDCQFIAHYRGGTMLGGPPQHYNRDGKLISANPNSMTVDVACRTCWRGWHVKRQT